MLAMEEPPNGGPYRGKPARDVGTATEIERPSTTDPAEPVKHDERDAAEAGARDGEDRERGCRYKRHRKTRGTVFGDGRELQRLRFELVRMVSPPFSGVRFLFYPVRPRYPTFRSWKRGAEASKCDPFGWGYPACPQTTWLRVPPIATVSAQSATGDN